MPKINLNSKERACFERLSKVINNYNLEKDNSALELKKKLEISISDIQIINIFNWDPLIWAQQICYHDSL